MNKKVMSSGIWFTISNFLIRSIGFITTPIFTRMLSTTEFGEYNNFITWTSILLIITSLNLEASLIRARFDFEKDLKNYVVSMIMLSTISTVLWYGFIVGFNIYFTKIFSMDLKYLNCMFIYLLFYPVINIFQTMERFQYRYKWTVLISIVIAISNSLLSVLFVYVLPDRLTGRIIGYVLPVLLIGIIIIFYFILIKTKIKIMYWRYAIPFTLPFIPHLLSMNLLSGMDRIMIKKVCGTEDLALYSLAYTCGSVISTLVSSINSAYSPWLSEMLSKRDYNSIRRISVPYVFFFCFCASGTVLVIPEILLFLGGKSYFEAVYVVPPVAASTIMQFIYCMYVNVEQYEKKTKIMACASVLSVIINYVLNSIFIPKYGYIAAAYTTYASYFVLMLLHIYIVKKIGKIYVYKNIKIFLIAILFSCVMFISSMIINRYIIRYMIVCIYALSVFIFILLNKNKLKNKF